MKRRTLLGTAVIAGLLSGTAPAAESYGSWDKESRIEYAMRYIETMKKRFSQRAAALERVTGQAHELGYKFFVGELDRKQERTLERFKEGRLSSKDTKEHIEGYLKDLEQVRVTLAKAEEAARASAKKEESGEKPAQVKEAEIYGVSVSASKLGVILDNSPSMAPHSPKLREEIGKEFARAHYVEVWGSFLRKPRRVIGEEPIIVNGRRGPDIQDGSPWYYVTPGEEHEPLDKAWRCPRIVQEDAHFTEVDLTRDNVSAILAMVNLRKVDAIYWFCDFDDDFDDDAVKMIARPILDRKVKLYVHTLKRRPPKLMVTLVERSGGSLVRHRP